MLCALFATTGPSVFGKCCQNAQRFSRREKSNRKHRKDCAFIKKAFCSYSVKQRILPNWMNIPSVIQRGLEHKTKYWIRSKKESGGSLFLWSPIYQDCPNDWHTNTTYRALFFSFDFTSSSRSIGCCLYREKSRKFFLYAVSTQQKSKHINQNPCWLFPAFLLRFRHRHFSKPDFPKFVALSSDPFPRQKVENCRLVYCTNKSFAPNGDYSPSSTVQSFPMSSSFCGTQHFECNAMMETKTVTEPRYSK